MATLYELTGNVLELQQLLESAVENEDVYRDTLEAVDGEFDLKIESYCKVIANLNAQAAPIIAEIERLKEKQLTIESNIKRLKDSMFEALKATGKDKSKGDLFTVSIQKNGGKLPLIIDVDESEIPKKFQKVTYSVDTEKLREAAENGKCKFAHLGERGEHLRIK